MTYQEVYLMDNLSIESKAIYGMLCSYAGMGATAYPSVDFMCDKLRISKSRFYKHVNLLVGAGVIKREQIKKGSNFSTNVYTLVPNLRNINLPHTENAYTGNKYPECEHARNKDTNNNTINNNTINNNSINTVICPEPKAPDKPAEISLMLNDKTEYPVYQEDIDNWSALYPAVNVMQELRKMKGWLDANPERRKTKRGIKRFVNSWLSREQDRGGNIQPQANSRSHTITEEERARLEAERIANRPEWMKNLKRDPDEEDIFS